MNPKKFVISKEQIKPLKCGLGGCLATDRITVEGRGVNFMYRQKPDRPDDSGWRFFSGFEEDQTYLENPDHLAIYDVNTIVNYEPDILSIVESAIGSVFERDPVSRKWKSVTDFEIPE